jgi:Domain of unknown function (DUF4430)
MNAGRGTAVVAALLWAALATAGCGLGAGAGVGEVGLTVTRDYGAVPMLHRTVEANESDTVMRLLEENAEISTRYGGGFVHTIDGVEETEAGGHPHDWFFYVDGVESAVGAAEYELEGGERIWWDHRDWLATNHVPAVVGSWPAPFATGYEGERRPVAVECEGGGVACTWVRGALLVAGIERASGTPAGALRILIGPWARLRTDRAAALIEAGPEESGVFADFERRGRAYSLIALDESGREGRELGPGAGLVAATRRYDAPPVWVVTGGTPGAVRTAARLLTVQRLRDHYAVASEDGVDTTPLPVGGG